MASNNPTGRIPVHGHAKRIGRSLTYKKWAGMKRRCAGHNPKDVIDYVSKGIRVCQRWESYGYFLSDMGECPEGLTLDRIDNAKGYEPGNCRWATYQTQANNRTIASLLTLDGVTLNVTEWARRTGIQQPTISYRIRAGWDVRSALTISPEIYKSR